MTVPATAASPASTIPPPGGTPVSGLRGLAGPHTAFLDP